MSRFTPISWIRLAAAAAMILVVSFLVAATAITPIRPSISRDFPDPMVLDTGDEYYAYSTESVYNHRRWHVPVLRAADPAGPWTVVGDAMPAVPAWATRDASGDTGITAPDVAPTPGGWLLYFVARSASANAQCIGTALGTSPAGPFAPTVTPLICQPAYVDSIDPQSFIDTESSASGTSIGTESSASGTSINTESSASGTSINTESSASGTSINTDSSASGTSIGADGGRYVLYASGQTRTTIWLQPVTADGLRPVGERRALISADRPDEHNIVEAPSLVRHGGRYVLFYSGDTYNSGGYFVNDAVAPSISGPFVKQPGQLVNRASLGGRWPDPGGAAVLDGDHLVFHASTGPAVRAMFVVPLSWDDDRPSVDLDNGLTHRYALDPVG